MRDKQLQENATDNRAGCPQARQAVRLPYN
jgi:hypothetical protein